MGLLAIAFGLKFNWASVSGQIFKVLLQRNCKGPPQRCKGILLLMVYFLKFDNSPSEIISGFLPRFKNVNLVAIVTITPYTVHFFFFYVESLRVLLMR